MEQRGLFTWDEIFTQPEAWSSALHLFSRQRRNIEDFFLDGKYSQVIFTGCGSTYYLSIAAAALFQELSGFPAGAFPASELWLYPETSYAGEGRSLLIATSRSGETTETLRACEVCLNQGRGDLLTLSCYIDKPLAKMGVLVPFGARVLFPPVPGHDRVCDVQDVQQVTVFFIRDLDVHG